MNKRQDSLRKFLLSQCVCTNTRGENVVTARQTTLYFCTSFSFKSAGQISQPCACRDDLSCSLYSKARCWSHKVNKKPARYCMRLILFNPSVNPQTSTWHYLLGGEIQSNQWLSAISTRKASAWFKRRWHWLKQSVRVYWFCARSRGRM